MENININNYLYLIPLFPLIGAIINGFFGKWLSKQVVFFVGVGVVTLSFMVSLTAFYFVWHDHVVLKNVLYSWMSSGDFNVNISFMLDPLSGVMILIVTGVSSLIHLYSIGYMAEDKSYWRYFSYLNLFVFAMILLVLGDNLLVMFVGWEGVGLCSYLLIGFWFEDDEKAIAGKKAFIVNRIGDFGFIIGIFLLYSYLGTVEFAGMKSAISSLPAEIATFACIMLFVGATGKSAQIPLYVWLPDAMAGPTPVSALIHAATMVTAGVYMVARLSFVYVLSETAMNLVAIFGALTVVFAATIGLVQNDIKKVLAYSTVSQLGYMFIGVGVGAFSAGVFHLMTHAFFKACLFLGSGSVIMAMHHEQDIRKMGGLFKKIPVTAWTFIIATIAIMGFPGTSGFFSKDEILAAAFASERGGVFIWVLGVIGATLTSFYMWRLVFLTFFSGETRCDEHTKHHIKESPFAMTSVLVVLAILSVIGGFVGVPEVLGGSNHFHHFLESSVSGAVKMNFPSHAAEYGMMGLVVGLGLFSMLIAYKFYFKKISDAPRNLANSFNKVYNLLLHKYYVDEIYQFIFVKTILIGGSKLLHSVVDVKIIDTFFVNGSAKLVRGTGQVLRYAQTGSVQLYAASILVGLAALLFYFLG